jgi:hypothetical protein
MTNFSKMHQLQAQSGLTKKGWNDVLNHATSAIAQCVKENKLTLDDAKSDKSISAIQDTLGIYHKIQLSGVDYVSDTRIVSMIKLQKQKKIDKEKLAEERRLGPEELEIYNQIAARGDQDTTAYNERIYQPYLSQFVKRGGNMNKDMYRVPEMIDRSYVSYDRVKDLIDKKYKKGDFYVKSIPELNKLYEVAQNVINNMEDPENAFETIKADTTRDFSKKLYNIASTVTPTAYQNILNENYDVEEELGEESGDEIIPEDQSSAAQPSN